MCILAGVLQPLILHRAIGCPTAAGGRRLANLPGAKSQQQEWAGRGRWATPFWRAEPWSKRNWWHFLDICDKVQNWGQKYPVGHIACWAFRPRIADVAENVWQVPAMCGITASWHLCRPPLGQFSSSVFSGSFAYINTSFYLAFSPMMYKHRQG